MNTKEINTTTVFRNALCRRYILLFPHATTAEYQQQQPENKHLHRAGRGRTCVKATDGRAIPTAPHDSTAAARCAQPLLPSALVSASFAEVFTPWEKPSASAVGWRRRAAWRAAGRRQKGSRNKTEQNRTRSKNKINTREQKVPKKKRSLQVDAIPRHRQVFDYLQAVCCSSAWGLDGQLAPTSRRVVLSWFIYYYIRALRTCSGQIHRRTSLRSMEGHWVLDPRNAEWHNKYDE